MSQRTSMRPPKGGNIKKGICQNHQYLNPDTGETGDCPKCASGEVQTVNVQRLSDFRCAVCGSKLVPVKDNPMEKMKKFILPVVGVIVVALLVLIGLKQCNNTPAEEDPGTTTGVEEPQTPPETGTDTLTVIEPESETNGEDSTEVIDEKTEPKDPVKDGPKTENRSVLGGAAKIVKNNGYTDLVFLRDYSLDLGKADGSKYNIRKGEKIERADIRHNVLRGGTHINLSKEENTLSSLNVKL